MPYSPDSRTHVNAPAGKGVAITPSDANPLPEGICRALYVGGDGGLGTLRVMMRDGGTVDFAGVQAGSILPFRVKQVFATGTGVTDLVALY